MLATSAGRVLAIGLLLVALGALVGAAVLWPDGESRVELGGSLTAPSERGEVLRVTEFPCSGFQTEVCRRVDVKLQSGPDEGRRTEIELGTSGLDPDLSVGDQLRLTRNVAPPGVDVPPYSLADFERRAPMLWLFLLFAGLVVLFGRLRGALSLVGLGASFVVILGFVVPALLDGRSPLAVSLVGALLVMFATIALAHGVGAKSLAAMGGTALTLLLIVGLAVAAQDMAHLTGLSSEEGTLLQANQSGISLEGLLVAGMVIGALGVLDDVTVSQSSTVMALRSAAPAAGFKSLYNQAVRVGRDHVSATVNTLVLAYAGASLPVLLLFSAGDLGFVETVNVELVAKEVVAMLVGSIGLVAAVPVTTGLAAAIAVRTPPEHMPEEVHAHAH